MDTKKEETELKPQRKKKVLAKKDWHIVQNQHDIKIKEGEDVSGLPKRFLEVLKIEKVI